MVAPGNGGSALSDRTANTGTLAPIPVNASIYAASLGALSTFGTSIQAFSRHVNTLARRTWARPTNRVDLLEEGVRKSDSIQEETVTAREGAGRAFRPGPGCDPPIGPVQFDSMTKEASLR